VEGIDVVLVLVLASVANAGARSVAQEEEDVVLFPSAVEEAVHTH
jgi:hypothetical protein